MATKTWTNDADFSESKGDFDGLKVGESDELVLTLQEAFGGRTWLGATDETAEWIADGTVYTKRGYWRVNFDSEGDAQMGWATLSWNSTEPDSSAIRVRARTAATEGALKGATWTDWYDSSPVDNEADDGRWCQLEVELIEGSTPVLLDLTQAYGEGC